jgi:hypothetical protein
MAGGACIGGVSFDDGTVLVVLAVIAPAFILASLVGEKYGPPQPTTRDLLDRIDDRFDVLEAKVELAGPVKTTGIQYASASVGNTGPAGPSQSQYNASFGRSAMDRAEAIDFAVGPSPRRVADFAGADNHLS